MVKRTELRCDHHMHGVVVGDGRIEVKCRQRYCGYRPGVVVLHYFDITTGQLLFTRKLSDPTKLVGKTTKKEKSA